jgi:hypothetical protein
MIRRLLVGALIVAAVAGFAPTAREQALFAAPSELSVASITFAEGATADAAPINERVYFDRDNSGIWAFVDFADGGPGTQLTYVLRLNGEDFTFGTIECCGGRSSGRMAFELRSVGRDELPGGAYRLVIFEGDRELGQGGFGVRGGQGADNGNAPSNSDPEDDDEDDDD